MAILKHKVIRNGDYGEAQRYLFFEHDSDTGKLIHDENGDMVLRKGILQTGLDCDPFTYNTECTELNMRMRKNLSSKEVKAHHYIISFDPKDISENSLTPQRAHEIGTEFARHFFDGHQVLVVTHLDGNNHAGNLHCHIVLNSLRKRNIDWQDFMERPIDALAGYKHHQTRNLLRYMQIWLTETCEQEHLHTVDFVLPANSKIKDREYWADRRGQEKLNKVNEEIIADGLTPRESDFATVKQQIRDAIDESIQHVSNFEELTNWLEQKYGIKTKISRRQFSYVRPEHTKPIRGKALGLSYDRSSIESRILGDENIVKSEYGNLPRVFLIASDLRLVTDIQSCIKAQQSRAYAQKVAISNLQQKARSLAYIQNHGIGTLDKLKSACEDAEKLYQEKSEELRQTRQELTSVNEQIHYLGQYLSGKKTYTDFLSAPDKAQFRSAHSAEIDKYEAARTRLQEILPDGNFPQMQTLKRERDRLQQSIAHQKAELKLVSNHRKTLRIVDRNIQSIFEDQSLLLGKATMSHDAATP